MTSQGRRRYWIRPSSPMCDFSAGGLGKWSLHWPLRQQCGGGTLGPVGWWWMSLPRRCDGPVLQCVGPAADSSVPVAVVRAIMRVSRRAMPPSPQYSSPKSAARSGCGTSSSSAASSKYLYLAAGMGSR